MVGPEHGNRFLTAVLIVLLVVLWGAVFIPAVLRARQETSPIVSVGRFRRRMTMLSPRGGRYVLMPARPESPESRRRRTIARRRHIFVALVAASLLTLPLGLVPMIRWMLVVHLGIDLLLAGYLFLLVRIKREGSVSYVPRHGYQGAPEEPHPVYLRAGEL